MIEYLHNERFKSCTRCSVGYVFLESSMFVDGIQVSFFFYTKQKQNNNKQKKKFSKSIIRVIRGFF